MTIPPRRHATELETIAVTVPPEAVEAYENALSIVCATIGIFEVDDAQTQWRVEGVRDIGNGEDELRTALVLAAALTGVDAPLERTPTESEGWLARTYEAFPEQTAGRRFAIRGTHLEPGTNPQRITLVLDAGVAFGSGEHGSTRGCLRALEMIAHRRPRRILDLGCGSGILAMAAAALLKQPVLATDIDPWSVRVTRRNARMNGLSHLLSCHLGNGWSTPAIRRHAPYDLVFANILARPLCSMAADLAHNLLPGGTAILAGLLNTQVRMVLSAHRRQGLVLERRLREGDWATLILRKPDA
ncbi:50S ribosomal protein L11 methyltransferase [Gluconacetobacter entanii]|uniref:Ribosomal protein L11 methyltransferase n=1 Tax=Gluconacetobacter entanii TaxID=108528 RepID=A0A318Q265_9PROT|nr:50S ribosomal protein L11 methyltransferase [Gluconacetobacter entanii]MBE7619997.1 methyltransferase [Komagataeibacter sp. FXV2]MCE2579989.1 50S ribosomal protein L11 methyltransferase [Komagataeibacter sp. FNDCR1]MBY4640243.1 50S ribosomal protein L11 methyltransferase [Gluconacetobacter entanii]MCW4582189.1 50S ribosomal protein L11 methyltransferase [Gluconacetobacter entanii]MCW4585452.1 50S ribosomal protein L11 methyltransferase [Gluconacetobacter entanii]